MGDTEQILAELIETVWSGLQRDVADLEPGEAEWRPVPEANPIAVIIRHLRVEAGWQLAALKDGVVMPEELSAADRERLALIPFDFEKNLEELTRLTEAYIGLMRKASIDLLKERTSHVYGPQGKAGIPQHFFGYHHAIHLAMHSGHVRMIRNLYRTTRGRPGRFFPDNPTFPVAGS